MARLHRALHLVVELTRNIRVTPKQYPLDMEGMSKRAHLRVACDRDGEILGGATTGPRIGPAHALDLSLSGALIAFEGALSTNTPYRLRLQNSDGPWEFPFRLAREAPRGRKYPKLRHYGLVFNLTSDQEKRLRKLIDSFRAQPTPDEDTLLDRLLRNYWK